MSKNLHSQLKHAVCECCCPGDSKRADKFNPAVNTEWKIYSTASRRDMLDLCRDFSRFMTETYPEVKKAYTLTPSMVQEFLNAKADTCTDKTLGKLLSRIGKLEKVCAHAYPRSCFHWETERLEKPVSRKAPAFVKDKPIPMEITREVISELRAKNRSQAVHAVTLSAYAGMRANEAAHCKAENVCLVGGPFGYGYISIPKGSEGGAKGGRARTIPVISKEAQDALREAIRGKSGGEYVAARADGQPMTAANVQRQLREHMDARYGKTYTGNRCHALRKTWAQSYYDLVRRNGCTRQEAVSKTNVVLGHGSKRGEEMVRMYVANIW